MEDSYPGKASVWESWTEAVVQDLPASGDVWPMLLPFNQNHVAEHLYAREALHGAASRPRLEAGAEPYSLQWFLNIENQRHGRQGRWIPRLLEFAKHSGDTLLGLGDGLGTDWVQYARHDAAVIVCSASAEQLTLIRRNFELRGLCGRFLHSLPAALPLESSSIDVVCASSLPSDPGEFEAVVHEVYRVLKPGGKVLAVTPARYDIAFWSQSLFPWQRWFGRQTVAERPPAQEFSARRLRRRFDRFVEHRVYKRQLRRSDVPHIWRWLPLPLLERLMGRVLVLKAFKPLSAAIPMQMAA